MKRFLLSLCLVALMAPVAYAQEPTAKDPLQTSPTAPKRWSVGLGGYYGYSIEESTDDDDKSAHLAGFQGAVEYALTRHNGIAVDLAVFNTLATSANDGYGYRAVVNVPFYFKATGFRPYAGPHVGYMGGRGVQDSIILGPLVGFQVDVADNIFLYAQAAYDSLIMRSDIGFGVFSGVISSNLGLGWRF